MTDILDTPEDPAEDDEGTAETGAEDEEDLTPEGDEPGDVPDDDVGEA